MTLGGYGPFQIAAQLSAEYIPILAYHQAQLGIELWQNRKIKNPYKWQSSTIAHMHRTITARDHYELTRNIPKCVDVECLCEGTNFQIPFNADEILF